MPLMGKTEEDWNGLKLGFLKTVQPNSFSKLIPAACNFKNNAEETYLFVTDFWFCHLHVFECIRVIGKIKQNEMDCRDTAPLRTVTKYKVSVQFLIYYYFSAFVWIVTEAFMVVTSAGNA